MLDSVLSFEFGYNRTDIFNLVWVENTLVFGFYGRSGQGVETAVKVFSKTAFMSGFYVQSFSFIGRGRRAFPVKGFVKLDKVPILSKQVEEPDFSLVFDPTLGMVAKDFKERSIVIFNSPERVVLPNLKKRKVRAYSIDATEIALSHLRMNVPNTVMLGALAKIFNKISMKALKAAMEYYGVDRQNFAMFDEGYRSMR